jgi:competence protein ComEC
LLPEAAAALVWLDGWLARYLALCARLVGNLPHSQVSSPSVLGVLVGAALVGALFLHMQGAKLRRAVAVASLMLALSVAWRVGLGDDEAPPAPEGLRITVLDVGQGDSILLQVPEGAILVDEGPPEADVAGQLDDLGVNSLTAIVLTHPERDHVGGAADVLERTRVGAVVDPLIPSSSDDERSALAVARERGVPVVAARAGRRLSLGGMRIRILWPEGPVPPTDNPNDFAVVLVVSYGEVDALLTADAEGPVTVPIRPPRVEILKVAHHGSDDPLLPSLLDLTDPRVAVVSVGDGNDYGHPTPSTMATLERFPGLGVYRTDRDGAVTIETDGERISVREER